MDKDTLIKMMLVILFLLFCYAMIGGYTPGQCYNNNQCGGSNTNQSENYSNCSFKSPSINIPNPYSAPQLREPEPVTNSQGTTIYQRGPYLNF